MATGIQITGIAFGLALGANLASKAARMAPATQRKTTLIWLALGLFAGSTFTQLERTRLFPPAYEVYEQAWSLEREAVHENTVTRPAHVIHGAVVSALTGVLAGLATSWLCMRGPRRSTNILRAIGWIAAWSIAVPVGAAVAYYATYLGRGLVTDLFESVGLAAIAGRLSGAAIGGFLGGYVLGGLARLAPDVTPELKAS